MMSLRPLIAEVFYLMNIFKDSKRCTKCLCIKSRDLFKKPTSNYCLKCEKRRPKRGMARKNKAKKIISYKDSYRIEQSLGIRKGAVYLIKLINGREQFLKLGYTGTSIKNRFKDLTFYKIEIITIFESNIAEAIEMRIHEKYKQQRYYPSVKFGGHTECYRLEMMDKLLSELTVSK